MFGSCFHVEHPDAANGSFSDFSTPQAFIRAEVALSIGAKAAKLRAALMSLSCSAPQ